MRDAMAVYGEGSPWTDGMTLSRRPVRGRTAWEDTPNATDLPVPGDPVPCTQDDADLWFSAKAVDQQYAKSRCAGCWMKQDCAEYGVAHPEEYGVWGGMHQSTRRAHAVVAKQRRKR